MIDPRQASLCALAALLAAGSATATPLPHDFAQDTARAAPAWAREGVIYEVWERAFSRAGDFDGITARLADLKELGVDILWLMPVNPIGQQGHKGTVGSPYAVRDYYGINPAYGTAADLKKLVARAHGLGMKVIVDVVYDHTAWDNALVTKRPELYHHDPQGHILSPEDWTDVAWLDYGRPELRQYATDALAYWIREFDLDGLRCDVAFMVPTDFWEAARRVLERVKPDLFMLAEAEEPSLVVRAFDSFYGWQVYHAVDDAIAARRPATAVREAWAKEKARMPKGALAMRISDDHDEMRAVARLGWQGALAAQALTFALDGMPLVYNGMEICDTGESAAPALFESVAILWEMRGKRLECGRFYRKMLALRRADPAMRSGALTWLDNSAPEQVVSLLRSAGRNQTVVLVNTSSSALTVKLVGPRLAPSALDVTPDLTTDAVPAPRSASLDAVNLGPWGFRILSLRSRSP